MPFQQPPLAAAERNFVEAWWHMATTDPGTESFEGDGIRAFITGDESPMMNGVLETRILGSNAWIDSVIERTVTRFQARGVPLLWWHLPSAEPLDLPDRLAARGFVHVENLPVMTMDLADLPPQPPIPGLAIERVRDSAGLETFLAIAVPVLEAPKSFEEAARQVFTADGFGDDAVGRHYVGYLAGRPVAASSLIFEANIAGIFNVASVEGVRGRGIGSALTIAPLHEAKALGYRMAALQSSPIGHGVYRRIGFRDVGAFGVHVLSPSPEGS